MNVYSPLFVLIIFIILSKKCTRQHFYSESYIEPEQAISFLLSFMLSRKERKGLDLGSNLLEIIKGN